MGPNALLIGRFRLQLFLIKAIDSAPEYRGETDMAKNNNLDKMSYAELADMEREIDRLKVAKRSNERSAVREKLIAMAKQNGFEISELFGKGNRGKGSVAVKYRDPKDSANTWTGRGRMPRWMAAATKGGKAKKEDFLV